MAEAGKTPPERITDLLSLWIEGDKDAGDRLFGVLYDHLGRLARARLRRRRGGDSLDTAALIHESYIKLTAGARVPLSSRAHFFALASRTMRQIIVDHARRRAARKRGGDLLRISSLHAAAPDGMRAEDLVALNEALERLESMEPRLARMVEMRFFGGLSVEETARALEISIATVKRLWLRARAFLYQQVRQGSGRR